MHRSANLPAPLRHALGLAALLALAACGGGGGGDGAPLAGAPAVTTVSGVVADGPLKGATVCYDLNDNGSCEADEPTSTPTDDEGRYQLNVPANLLGQHGVVAQVPAGAVDKDKPGVAVGAAFTLRAPVQADGQVFVSPLTTLVADLVKSRGLSVAQASDEVKQQLGLAASPLANFVAASDNHAAVLARTVNSVIVEVSRMASAAGVSAADTRTLVAATIAADLPVLAARVQKAVESATGSDLDKRLAAASAVSTAVLADKNISSTTVAIQASVAKKILSANGDGATPSGWNESSVRRFRYTDANNYSYTLTGGDTGRLNSNGQIDYDEVRSERVAGVVKPFNRNEVWWSGGDWRLCGSGFKIGQFTQQTATDPQRGQHCMASQWESRIVYKDIAGQRLADVVAEIRAFPLRDNDGNVPSAWGADPSSLGDTVFPAGAQMSTRQTLNDIGGSEVYYLTSRPRVFPSWQYVATLDELKPMVGDYTGQAVSNLNTVYLDDLTIVQPNAALRPFKRFVVGFDPNPNSDAVRFFKCDVPLNTENTSSCEAAGGGRVAVTAQGDSRVMRFTGYPVDMLAQRNAQRNFVQRNGLVYRGFTWVQNSSHSQRLNGPAWDTLRNTLGIPAPVLPSAPDTLAPWTVVGSFSYTDVGNYRYGGASRSTPIPENSVYDYQEFNTGMTGGVAWPSPTASVETWTGTAWLACTTGTGSVDPVTKISTSCSGSNRITTIPVTMDGRLMADVVREIRWHPGMESWGADPAVFAGQLSGLFPVGSTLQYATRVRLSAPMQTLLSASVRVPPSLTDTDTGAWPVANTLDTAVVAYLGELFGVPLSANTTLLLGQTFSTTLNASGLKDEVQTRVSFDPVGNRVKFWRTQVLNNTGLPGPYALGPFELLMETTFRIDTVGDRRVLSYDRVPDALLAQTGGTAPMLIERQGYVYQGRQATTFDPALTPAYNYIRLTGTAWTALRTALGITTP